MPINSTAIPAPTPPTATPDTTQTPTVTDTPAPAGAPAPSTATPTPRRHSTQQPQVPAAVSSDAAAEDDKQRTWTHTLCRVFTDSLNRQSPSVRRGDRYTVAQALAGGPRYRGGCQHWGDSYLRLLVPMSESSISGMGDLDQRPSRWFQMGSVAGRGQGPGSCGGSLASNGGIKIGQQRQQQNQQAAQHFSESAEPMLPKTLTQRARPPRRNSRTLLNTSEAEQQAADANREVS